MRYKIPGFLYHILDGLFVKFKGYYHGTTGNRTRSIFGFTEVRKNAKIIGAYPTNHGEKMV